MTHGGKRKGAGRPRLYDGPTIHVQVPVPVVDKVRAVIKKFIDTSIKQGK